MILSSTKPISVFIIAGRSHVSVIIGQHDFEQSLPSLSWGLNRVSTYRHVMYLLGPRKVAIHTLLVVRKIKNKTSSSSTLFIDKELLIKTIVQERNKNRAIYTAYTACQMRVSFAQLSGQTTKHVAFMSVRGISCFPPSSCVFTIRFSMESSMVCCRMISNLYPAIVSISGLKDG